MIFFILLFIFAIYFVIRLFWERDNSPKTTGSSFLIRFKSRFKNRDRLRAKLSEDFSNSLLLDPEYNITISSWYTESELREKADIHRARLSKYGRSKMNGEMLFLGPKGGVYKYNTDGKKKYL